MTSKTTFARIDFLRLGERLVNEKGTHNVKISAEKWTETDKLGVDKLASWQVDRVDQLTSSPVNGLTNQREWTS